MPEAVVAPAVDLMFGFALVEVAVADACTVGTHGEKRFGMLSTKVSCGVVFGSTWRCLSVVVSPPTINPHIIVEGTCMIAP